MKTTVKLINCNPLSILVILAFISVSCGNTVKSDPPNIIIFFTDDQGYGDLGCYGANDFQTPNIDRLAGEGILFKQFYVPASVCTPSRASLLTGRYSKRVGLDKGVIRPYSTNGLSPDEITIAELLKPLGYSTACIGKWHLGNQIRYSPNNQGFDYFYGVPYSNDMDRYYYKKNHFQSPPLPVYKNWDIVEKGPDQNYLTKMWTGAAVRFIRENSNAPFFLYLAHNMPHGPWHASKKFRGSSQRGLYGDVIQELDWSMGEILKVLEEKKILDNTLIIFTSDNGPVSRLKSGGSAGPLRGGKATTWEGGMRVPGIISWPAQIPKGVTTNEPVSTLDLLPTIVDLAGGELPNGLKIDGQNISDFLLNPGKYQSRKFELLYYGHTGELEAYTDGKWKLHIAKKRGWPPTKGNFPVSLFNLKQDISESQNLAKDYPEIVNKMEQRMELIDVQITDEIN